MICNLCGRKSSTFNFVPFYACLSPRCNEKGISYCYSCLEKKGVKKNFLKIPIECPFCNIGKLESLGTK